MTILLYLEKLINNLQIKLWGRSEVAGDLILSTIALSGFVSFILTVI